MGWQIYVEDVVMHVARCSESDCDWQPEPTWDAHAAHAQADEHYRWHSEQYRLEQFCDRLDDNASHTWESRGVDVQRLDGVEQLVNVRSCVRCPAEQIKPYGKRSAWREIGYVSG